MATRERRYLLTNGYYENADHVCIDDLLISRFGMVHWI